MCSVYSVRGLFRPVAQHDSDEIYAQDRQNVLAKYLGPSASAELKPEEGGESRKALTTLDTV